MNAALVEKVVNAVLYEGYILYPYRASSQKNRERFTFGRVYPEDYSIAQEGAEPSLMQTECLVRNESKDAVLKISVRFLHPMAREVGLLSAPLAEMPAGEPPAFEVVPDLRVGEQLYQTWQEVVEQKVELPPLSRCGPRRKSRIHSIFQARAWSSRFAPRMEKSSLSSCGARRASAE